MLFKVHLSAFRVKACEVLCRSRGTIRIAGLFALILSLQLVWGSGSDVPCASGGYKIVKAVGANPATVYRVREETDASLQIEEYIADAKITSTAFGYSKRFQRFFAASKNNKDVDGDGVNNFEKGCIYTIDANGAAQKVDGVECGEDQDIVRKIGMDISAGEPEYLYVYVYKPDETTGNVVYSGVEKYEILEGNNGVPYLNLVETLGIGGSSIPGADIAVHPSSGLIYAFAADDDGSHVVRVYENSGDGQLLYQYRVDQASESALPSGADAGSQWFDGQGRLYAWLNATSEDGNYHLWRFTFDDFNEIALGEDLGSTGSIGGKGDGASCSSYGTLVSGRVFEDLAGDGINGDEAPLPNVSIYLYDSEVNLVGSTKTDAQGKYRFYVLNPAEYFIVVDSKSILPTQGFNEGYGRGDVWAEQTYAPVGGLCDDPESGPSERSSPGPCYGGRLGSRSDDASSLESAEHLARILVDGETTGLDFGFSFNVVSNTNDQDHDREAARARVV